MLKGHRSHSLEKVECVWGGGGINLLGILPVFMVLTMIVI
jgi:hypothetical protein